MKNILSFKRGTPVSGKEILNWAKFQVAYGTSHRTQGKQILRRFYNLRPDKMYNIYTSYPGVGAGEVIHDMLITKIS